MIDAAFAVAGSLLMIAAYVPQVTHMIKERCTAGISLFAYSLWSLAAAILFTHAFMIHDAVFILVQGFTLIATWIITFYTWRHPGNRCPIHRTS
jgi:uncharacterized protein with PQ loop repeat